MSASLFNKIRAHIHEQFEQLFDKRTVVEVRDGYLVVENEKGHRRNIQKLLGVPVSPGDDVVVMRVFGDIIAVGVLSTVGVSEATVVPEHVHPYAPNESLPDAYQVRDHFVSGSTTSGEVGELGWLYTGTLTNDLAQPKTPGIVTLSTGSAISTVAALYTRSAGGFMHVSDSFDITVRFRLNVLDATTQLRIGLLSTATTVPTAGVYLEKLGHSTFIRGMIRKDAGTIQATSGIVEMVAGTWYTVRVRRISVGRYGFTFPGEAERQMTALIVPTGAFALAVQIVNDDAVDKSVSIDYVDARMFDLS